MLIDRSWKMLEGWNGDHVIKVRQFCWKWEISYKHFSYVFHTYIQHSSTNVADFEQKDLLIFIAGEIFSRIHRIFA